MDKVQKHNSFNTNAPSSESYRNYTSILQWDFMVWCSVKAYYYYHHHHHHIPLF